MITRRAFVPLMGSALVVPPSLAKAGDLNVPVTLDIIPTAGRSDQSIFYNVGGWTNIGYVSGQTCFTCHTQTIRGGPFRKVTEAGLVVCLSGPGQVWFNSFHYDVYPHRVVDYSWSPPIQCQPQYSPQNVGVDITQHWNDVVTNAPRTRWTTFTADVLGVGNVYMIRLELVFDTGSAP